MEAGLQPPVCLLRFQKEFVSGFSRNLCVTFSQGCNKVLWGVIGAAVVITLITIPAVYFSSKLQPPGLCMRFSPVCDHEQKDN